MDFYNKPLPKVYLLRYNKPSPQEYLAHHGIRGQRWGKRNGPPYPLDAEDHSASEKRAGWRKSLDKGGKKADNEKRRRNGDSKKKGLSDKQKRAIKIGVAAAVTALAIYGGYKLKQSGKLDPLIEKLKDRGEKRSGDILEQLGKKPISSFDSAPAKKAVETVKGIKKLAQPESFEDTLKRTNPQRGNTLYDNNCVLCAIAGFMRQSGYDVTAGRTGGSPLNPAATVEKCFKGAKIVEGSAVKFGRSQKDAAQAIWP